MNEYQPNQPGSDTEALLARGSNFDFGKALSDGFTLYKANFGMFFGAGLLIMVLYLVLQIPSQIGSAMMNFQQLHEGDHQPSAGAFAIGGFFSLISTILTAIFAGPLYGGLSMYMLRTKRGEKPEFGQVFEGFGAPFVQLMLASIVSTFLMFIGFLLCILPGIYLAVGWMFAFLIVIDKGLGFWDAMELSRKMVTKNWFLFFAFCLVAGILGCLGLVACGIGILVTLPFAWSAIVCVYDDVFGEAAPPALEPGVHQA